VEKKSPEGGTSISKSGGLWQHFKISLAHVWDMFASLRMGLDRACEYTFTGSRNPIE